MSNPTYDIKWLATATFADLDAAMKDITTRRILEPTLRTPEGEAIARKIIENRGKEAQTATGQYDLNWMKSIRPLPNALALLKAALLDPEGRKQLDRVMRTVEGATIASRIINNVELSPEELPVDEQVEIQSDLARAEAQATADAAVATPAEVVAAPVVVATVPEKVVIDYQVTDEAGQPIGRRTHFECKDKDEAIEKIKTAHVNAVRYAERLKKNQVKSAESFTQRKQAQQQVEQLDTEAAQAVDEAKKDPSKLQDAITKVSKADREKEALRRAAYAQGQVIAQTWMEDHKDDFVECEASSKILGDWLVANQRELSYENLELAFEATKNKLPKPTPVTEEPAAQVINPPAAASAAPAAPAAPIPPPAAVATETASTATPVIPQPQATASQPTPAAAKNTPAARRPGVNGSMQPGTMSAQRPSATAATSTTDNSARDFRRLVAKMPPAEFRKRMATSDEFRAQAKAAGIIDAAQRQ